MKVKAFTGMMLTLFLVATLFTAIPINASPGWDGEIKIAVVGPQGWIQWDGLWVGAVMARDIVNLGPNGEDDGGDGDDGIIIGGLNYKVVLRAVDSHAVPEPEPAKGWNELLAALEWGADIVMGGFRTECVAPMRLNFLDYCQAKYAANEKTPIWIIAGASTDELVDCRGRATCEDTCVRCNYDYGRYMFRVTPMAGTELVPQYVMLLRFWIIPFKLGPIYGGAVVGSDPGPKVADPDVRLFRDVFGVTVPVYENHIKTYLVMEDLTWTIIMGQIMKGGMIPGYPEPPSDDALLGPNVEVVGYARTHALTPVLEPVFTDIDDKNSRLIVHIYSAVTGIDFIKKWNEKNTEAVCVGINVESQMQEFWDKVGGACEYETFLASVGTRTNVNPNAQPYSTEEVWDLYKERSDEILTDFWGSPMPSTCPVYTMWGSYDGIIGLDEQLENWASWPAGDAQTHVDTLIADTEAIYRTGTLGTFMYTDYHDVYTDPGAVSPYWSPPYLVRSQITQWQAGELQVVWPMNCSYSRRYVVPPLMYSLADTDVAGHPALGGPFADGYVDGTDMGYVGMYWQTRWPNINIEVDLDNNGVITIRDASRVGRDFGKSWITEGYSSWPLP